MLKQLFNSRRDKRGFTLIELLVVIGILAVLLAIVLVAINPARQFSQANDTKRSSDINAILNAVHQYGADNRGNIGALNIPTIPTDADETYMGNEIAATATDPATVTGTGICAIVPTYIAALPADPLVNDNGTPVEETECAATGADWVTGYGIAQSENGRITVYADGEIAGRLQVTR